MEEPKALALDPRRQRYTIEDAISLTASVYAEPTPESPMRWARDKDGSLISVITRTPYESTMGMHQVQLWEMIRTGRVSPRSVKSGVEAGTVGITLDMSNPDDSKNYFLTRDDFLKFCSALAIDAHIEEIEEDGGESKALSTGLEASHSEKPAIGESKGRILAAPWPLPSGKSLEPFLTDVPKWLKDAIVTRGAPGRGAHTWDPATIAFCLASTAKGRKWTVSRDRLDMLIRRHFPAWVDQWERHSEMLP